MNKYLILCLVALCAVSCKVTQKIAVHKEVPNITEGKLLKNIYSNELEYNSLYAKKLDVSIDRNGKKDNLKAVLKIQRDSFIWMSLTAPLGIEIARLLLTPDSIKFVDSYNKKYFFESYRFFDEQFDIRINFDCFQRLLTNVYFDLDGCGREELKDTKFKFERTGTDYVLSNVQEKALGRKIRKFFKKRMKNKEYTLIFQKIHIDPDLFRPSRISLEDLEDNLGINAVYTDFKDFEGKIFPERITWNVVFDEVKLKLELKFSKLEFDVKVIPNLRISSKYKPMLVGH